jgi:hypothetical protein
MAKNALNVLARSLIESDKDGGFGPVVYDENLEVEVWEWAARKQLAALDAAGLEVRRKSAATVESALHVVYGGKPPEDSLEAARSVDGHCNL